MKSLKKIDVNPDLRLDEKRVNRQQLRHLLRDFSCEMPIIGISPESSDTDARNRNEKSRQEIDFTFLRELFQGASSLNVPFVIFQNKKSEQKIPFDLYDFVNVVVIDLSNSCKPRTAVSAPPHCTYPYSSVGTSSSPCIPSVCRSFSKKNLNISNHLFFGCDAVICFSEKSVNDCFSSGIVPIASAELRNVVNYNPNHETGNSFVFEKKDAWQIFAATVRAIETYRFPFDWKWIIRNGRKC